MPRRFLRVFVSALLIISLMNALVTHPFQSTPAYSVFSMSYFQAVALPIALVPNPDSNKLYVLHDENFISVMDIVSGKILGRIYFDENYKRPLVPEVSLAVNAKTNTLYATVQYSDTLYVIDGEQDKVVSKINLEGIGHSVAVNSDTNRVYVTAGNNLLYVLDGSSQELIATIDIGDHFYLSGDVGGFVKAELSVNPKTNLIYATNAGQNVISVINGSTNAIIGNITGFNYPYSAVINPATDKLYITDGGQDQITVVNGSTFEPVAVIPEVFSGYFGKGIAVDETENKIYVLFSSRKDIAVIDGVTDRVTNVISTGPAPLTVSVNSKTSRVFVTVEYSARISVIDNPEDSPSSREPPVGIHPIVTHLDGSPFEDMERPGQQLIISYEFYNDGSIEQSDSEVVAIFEIRDEENTTIFLSLQVTNVEPFISKSVEVSWMGEKPGGYWIHTMLLTGFEQPQPIGGKNVWGLEMADQVDTLQN